MLVKEIMSTAVKTATPDTLVRDVAVTMCFNKISGVPVIGPDHTIVGMISEKDILWGMFPDLQELMSAGSAAVDFEQLERDYKDVLNQKVSSLMTTRVFTVEPSIPVLKAASIMFRNRIRRIPVAQGGKLIGIISVGDVHKAIFHCNLSER